MPPSTAAKPLPQAATTTRGWYVVALLGLLYATSFVDRFILALLVDPVAAEFGVADTQIGLLFGATFAVLYSLMGLPLANLLDRGNRRNIVVAGAALWSVATMASGFSPSFELLALSRAGVAIGEAVLTPAAVSLIADLFPRTGRARPLATYGAVGVVMGSGSFVVGGAALQLATLLSPSVGAAPWRITMTMVGLPGLLLALLFMAIVREPRRAAMEEQAGVSGSEPVPVRVFLAFLMRYWRVFILYFVAHSLAALFVMGKLAWLPSLMVRGHGMRTADAAYMIGTSGMIAGVLGAVLWSWIAERLMRSGRSDAILLCISIATLIAIPLMILAPASPHPLVVIFGLAAAHVALGGKATLGPLALQTYGPNRMHARLMALSMLASSLVGMGLGPLTVAFAARWWGDDPHALGYGLSVQGAFSGPLALLFVELSRRSLKRYPELTQG